jgi:hypothetical protein
LDPIVITSFPGQVKWDVALFDKEQGRRIPSNLQPTEKISFRTHCGCRGAPASVLVAICDGQGNREGIA